MRQIRSEDKILVILDSEVLQDFQSMKKNIKWRQAQNTTQLSSPKQRPLLNLAYMLEEQLKDSIH